MLATIDWDITLPLFGYKLLKGDFYLAYELILDLFGLFFVIGLGMAVYRRFVVRPARIDPTAHFAWVLTLLFADQPDRLRHGGLPAGRGASRGGRRGRRWATRWVRACWPSA